MGETLDMIHPGSEFLSISRHVKLANMLPALQIQWWNRITVLDISTPKVGKWREERSHWDQAVLKSNWEKYIRFQGLEIILFCSWPWGLRLPSQNLRLYPWSHPSFFRKGSVYLHLSIFISLFPVCGILVCLSSFILSALVPFSLRCGVLLV